MDRARRRRFLIVSGAILAIPRALLAQVRTHRIAFLGIASAQVSAPYQKIFFTRLAELGYHEGRNLVVDRRLAEGNLDRLPALAKELVELKPDLIVTSTTPSTLAALKATRTIPVVFVTVADPVGAGIVQSLARPGGNATGTSTPNVLQLQAKQLQMLKEILPTATRVVLLLNPLNPAELQQAAALKAEAPRLGLSLQQIEVEKDAAFPQAFKSIELAKPDALYVAQGAFATTHAPRIMEFANGRKVPVVGGTPELVEAGALMTYVGNLGEYWRVAAAQAAKILDGAKPADLPVQLASTFEMVINLKAAKALGIKIPPPILLRADRVIE